jgi:hypothetical protein
MTHKPASEKPRAVNLFALPCGGFEVRDPFFGREARDPMIGHRGDILYNETIAAFSTLAQALDWLRENMAQPVTDTKP